LQRRVCGLRIQEPVTKVIERPGFGDGALPGEAPGHHLFQPPLEILVTERAFSELGMYLLRLCHWSHELPPLLVVRIDHPFAKTVACNSARACDGGGERRPLERSELM